jgi:SpoVK/Ycf46/Vps4 family AAA+-type ATPase
LESNFQLAHRWGCVLLLDEADIFLQKRDKADIKRNAIVSVFLRTLEYYRGILFLTTNRVGTFDPAFRSRIHVSLYYPPLKKDATMQIWRMHLERTEALKGHDQNIDFRINSKEILKYAKEHYYDLKKNGAGSWNGR